MHYATTDGFLLQEAKIVAQPLFFAASLFAK
jgi:hypothetical protein